MEGLRVRQLDDIYEYMRDILDYKSEIAVWKFFGIKEMKIWVSSASKWCEMEERLMRVLRGVVCRLKRIGPRTESCGTPHVRGSEGER